MFYAVLICSDEACPHELETWGDLEELEALLCDCGCALHVVKLSEVDFDEPVLDDWALPLAA